MTEERNTILITREEDTRLYAALTGDRVMYLIRESIADLSDAQALQVGAIYTGRIEQIVDNLDAAFVRLTMKENGYLPLKEIPAVWKKENLRPGMTLPVQIVAPPRGSKQVRLTSYLTLSGYQAVLMYGERGVGCSAKLPTMQRSLLTEGVRKELKKRGEEDLIKRCSVIIRTEAAEHEIESITDEALRLDKEMREILQKADTRTVGTKLTKSDESLSVTEHFLRLFHFLQKADPARTVRVLTDDKMVFSVLTGTGITADHPTLRIEERTAEERSLSTIYGLKGLLRDLKKRVVYLKSGGSIVIDETEAMTVVDVNSGKYVKKYRRSRGDIREEEALKINLEAAEEILRQIRLRNFSGMILVDFINMHQGADYQTLSTRIEEIAAQDPVRTRFHDFTALGIAELTRSRGE